MHAMTYALAALLVLVNAACLLLVVFGLPGIWVMVGTTALVAWWRHAAGAPMFGVPVLVTIIALALASELAEFMAASAGTRSAGGTRKGAWGALLGSFVGALAGTLIPIPVLGSLIGACAGAAIGACIFELRGGMTVRNSLRSGAGAGMGRLTGTVAKLVFALAIWVVIGVAAFWG
jgi:uncharacterized protein